MTNKVNIDNFINNYSIPVLHMIQKIDKGEDCFDECSYIRERCTEEEKLDVINKLFDKINQNIHTDTDLYLIADCIKQIGYLDPDYVDDYLTLIMYHHDCSYSVEKISRIKSIVNRRTRYGKTAGMYSFIKNITNIVASLDDSQLLIDLINKLENNKF